MAAYNIIRRTLIRDKTFLHNSGTHRGHDVAGSADGLVRIERGARRRCPSFRTRRACRARCADGTSAHPAKRMQTESEGANLLSHHKGLTQHVLETISPPYGRGEIFGARAK